MVFAGVDAGTAEEGWVAAVHLRSGAEWLVALANGADATFTAEKESPTGLILLKARRSESTLSLGVLGDYLVIARTVESLRLAAPFVVRTVAPGAGPGEVIELTVPKVALSGALSKALRVSVTELLRNWQLADAQNRTLHGGRAPDFGEPAAIIAGASAMFERLLGVVDTAKQLRLTAALLDEVPLFRAELEPEATGAARDLLLGMDTGELQPLLRLPS